jgi:hypothetical protein
MPNPQAGGPNLEGCLRLLYSVYNSQLSSISGGRLFHPQPADTPCRGDKETSNRIPWQIRGFVKYAEQCPVGIETRLRLGRPGNRGAIPCSVRSALEPMQPFQRVPYALSPEVKLEEA